jgi:GrpB-like predicted nucleotidyltransferase (UPF0157 family)
LGALHRHRGALAPDADHEATRAARRSWSVVIACSWCWCSPRRPSAEENGAAEGRENEVAEILQRALRANPTQRTRIRMMRTELARVAASLRQVAWPIAVASNDPDASGPRASLVRR